MTSFIIKYKNIFKKNKLHLLKFHSILGLRRRALGLFKTSSTTALLHKIAKHCPEADRISKKVQEIENVDPNRRSSSSSDSVSKPTLKKNLSFSTSPLPRYLWIRYSKKRKIFKQIKKHVCFKQKLIILIMVSD